MKATLADLRETKSKLENANSQLQAAALKRNLDYTKIAKLNHKVKKLNDEMKDFSKK